MIRMKIQPLLACCLLGILLTGCAQNQPAVAEAVEEKTDKESSENVSDIKPLVNRVLTREEQAKLTPEEVLTLLKEGNQRFVAGTLTARDHSRQVREAALGQYPKAVILSCLDSRVPVEDVFDRGIGDIFVARVAGNFENTDILGSMEFACKVAGSKLVFVLGHESCGAVNGAIDGVELGNITSMLANIKPAVDHFKDYKGEKTSKNPEFVKMVIAQNVLGTIDRIRINSPILKEMEKQGEIKIVGGVYNMQTGEVDLLEQ
ncbi:carbonic anhydrase family protein [Gimesia maris]|jgi:carbonic anhydrase|uniref:Carbonic anhydrase 2 n=2 Tax=Gimesia maris TaxID=122 RepID=A0ABX5YQH1_9PLAN|nr:carbonic anhydrase family protein [Gimesia maris]EDL56188.1 carbonic anhydrase [Gimesia maris DSM 8797]MAC55211.1 carbonic anhydrase [Gimesia sp.]QEG17916.1 Carbonic anhydrase 2 [Gimesia maris]|tara:strand:+ start:16639 stop:17421 length:783 start_codon:yes stop_codon:yes gene_type:complete